MALFVLNNCLFVLLVFSSFHFSFSLRYANPNNHNNKPPKIWLVKYRQVDAFEAHYPDERFQSQNKFENDFISKNGTDYVISEGLHSVVFTCEADYPIQWKFPFSKELYDFFVPTNSRASYITTNPYISEPINTRFRSFVTVYIHPEIFLSVNLTCSAIDNNLVHLTSNVYAFVDGINRIDKKGKTLEVCVEASNDIKKSNEYQHSIILPCRPSLPTLKLKLEQEIPAVANNTPISWQPVAVFEPNIHFDPKIGFTIKAGLPLNRILGLYRCSVSDSNDDNTDAIRNGEFVFVNVTTASTTTAKNSDINSSPHSILHGKASIHVEKVYIDRFSRLEIRCCSGIQNVPPVLASNQCASPQECEMLTKYLLGTMPLRKEDVRQYISSDAYVKDNGTDADCPSMFLYDSVSEIFVCNGDNVDYLEQFVTIFHPEAGGLVTNRSLRIQDGNDLKGNKTQIASLTKFATVSVAQKATVSEKMIVLVARQFRRSTLIRRSFIYLMDHPADAILDADLVNGYWEIDEMFTNKYLEYNRDVYYEGEPLTFVCLGVRYFYTSEAHIRLNWQNGSKTVLGIATKNAPGSVSNIRITRQLYLTKDTTMFNDRGSSVLAKFGTVILAQQNMSSVDCWMPLVASAKWDKISKPVQVVPSEAPKFKEENETLYLYLGDTGPVITCTLIQGRPIPKVSVTKDGVPLKLLINLNSKKNVTSVVNKTTGTETVSKKKYAITIRMPLSVITLQHQIVLQCRAKNFNGTATRTVTIFVLECPGKALPISLSIVGILLAIFVGLGIRRWYFGKRLRPTQRSIQPNV